MMREPYGWERPIKSQSPPARCYRDLDGKVCGAELWMVVTKSPLTNEPYEHLVVQRCAEGHINRVSGVLLWTPEVWADEGPHGL